MRKVRVPEVVTALEATESPLPPQIQEALGELVGAAREGLLALSVGVGLGVVHELMELEVVRHEALSDRAGCETAAGLSQQPGEAGGSPNPELWVRAGAAPTTPGRASTIGSCGSGKQDGAVQRK